MLLMVSGFNPTICEAQTKEERLEFLLGLKDPALRNEQGAKALAHRLRDRLRAARLQEHRVEVVAARGEVRVTVETKLPAARLEAMLKARGEVLLVPAASNVKDLKDLAPLLPDGVHLGQRLLVSGETDLFLHSKRRALLEKTVDKLSLWSFDVVIGPLVEDERRLAGFRTWMLKRGGASLNSKGLEGASVVSGVHPNYHFVTLSWVDSGLAALTRESEGGALLLVVDGVLEHVLSVDRSTEDGQMKVLLPALGASQQLSRAQMMAGVLGSAAHPCEIVVLSAGRTK
jgi:hypothetical protein